MQGACSCRVCAERGGGANSQAPAPTHPHEPLPHSPSAPLLSYPTSPPPSYPPHHRLQILVVMGLLVRVIHWAPALAGLAVTIALIPLSAFVGKRLAAVRRELIGFTDARVKLCTEVITGVWVCVRSGCWSCCGHAGRELGGSW